MSEKNKEDIDVKILSSGRYGANIRGDYNRKDIENTKALKEFKKEQFDGKKTVNDPITGRTLHFEAKNAKNKYGSKRYTIHSADIDHVIPAKKIYDKNKYNQFLSGSDIKEIANIEKNYAVRSSNYNRSKGSLTDSEYVKKHPDMDGKQKSLLLYDEKKAEKAIKDKTAELTVKGAAECAKTTAINSAMFSTAIYGAKNIYKLTKGDITALEAAENTAIDVSKQAAKDVTLMLSKKTADSMILKSADKLANASVKNAAKSFVANDGATVAIEFVVETSKSFYRLINTDIDSEEFILEVSSNSIQVICSFLGGLAGVAISAELGIASCGISLPLTGTVISLGELIGNYVGYLIGAAICNTVGRIYHHHDIIVMGDYYRELRDRLYQQRMEFEAAAARFLEQKTKAVSRSFERLYNALVDFDCDEMDNALETILCEFGEHIRFKTQEEFDDFMMGNDPMWV